MATRSDEEKKRVGENIRRRREDELGMSREEFAEDLDVSLATISNWEAGVHFPYSKNFAPIAKSLDTSVESIFGQKAPKTNDRSKKSRTSTNVDYNGQRNEDSAPSDKDLEIAETISDQRTIRAVAFAVSPFAVWSAKGAQRATVITFRFLALGNILVKFAESNTPLDFRAGTSLVFQPTDYPSASVYLFCSERAHPDNKTVRYIDPQKPTELQGGDGVEPLPLDKWKVEGKMIAEIHGDTPDAPFFVFTPGIGPTNRIKTF